MRAHETTHRLDEVQAPNNTLTTTKRRGSDSIGADLMLKKKRTDHIASGYTVQVHSCKDHGFDPHLSCFVCSTGSGKQPANDDECRFQNFRWFKSLGNNFSFIFDGSSTRSENHNTYGYHDWNPSRTESHKLVIKVTRCFILFYNANFRFSQSATAVSLLPRMEAELQHLQKPDCAFKAVLASCNYTCGTNI